MVLRIFKTDLDLRNRHVFMRQSPEILIVFNAVTLTHIFWKTKIFFKKMGYRFFVGNTKFEKAIFPYKTPLTETNVKAHRRRSTKWSYHRERSLAVTISFFWKLCFSIKTFKKSCFDVLTTQMSAFILFVSAGVFLGCVFPVSILKLVIIGSSLTFTIAQEKHILFLKFSQEDVYVWWCVVFSHCIFFNLKITDAIKWNIDKH